MTGRRSPLSRRLLQVAAASGVVVAVVTFVLTVPIVQGVARDEARDQLAASVDQLAARPLRAAQVLASQQEVVGNDDRLYAVVRRDGERLGPGARFLDDQQVADLFSRGRVSTSVTVGGEEYLVEGRTARRGFAAVAVQQVTAADDATRALSRRIVIALVLGVVAAGLVALVASRALTRPVAAAAAAARRLAAGERRIAVPTSSVTEIDDMGRALGALDDALSASEARQREFLLSVSHEMRTPLTALRGYAEALADGAISGDDVRDTGRTLVAETERLDRFIADLLALARLEADDFAVDVSDVALAPLLADLAAAWGATCEREGITLTVSGSADARTDAQRLRQVLDGLVENALRVTPDGGRVAVEVMADGDRVVVRVSDDGPGLSPDDLASAFDRGVLRDRYVGSRPVGTGLGLSIAQRLSERMGADLTAASGVGEEGGGGGATFTLALPATDTGGAAPR